MSDHERRLTRLEVVSTPRRSSAPGKAPPAPPRTPSGPGAHTVRAGETPSSIARKYGVTAAQLMKANGLASGAVIRPGQRLSLPGSGKAKTPAPTPAMAVPAPSPKRSAAPSKAPSKTPSKAAPAWGRHTVQRGETVRGLASQFGLSQKELMRLNGLKDPTKLRAGAVLKYPVAAGATETPDADAEPAGEVLPPDWQWHTVQRGESLSQIAARHGHDRRSLEQANSLEAGASIHEGLRLRIPPPGTEYEPAASEAAKRPPAGEDHSVLAYTVQKGDTLEELSTTFGTTPASLRKLNRLAAGDTVAAGQRIVVPNTLFEAQ